MRFYIQYSCASHIGLRRGINQDNFICAGQYMADHRNPPPFPLSGCVKNGRLAVFGVFDGMGGEEHGEIASLLAAKEASHVKMGRTPADALKDFCEIANARIYQYAKKKDIYSMGTTAALLAFSDRKISLCNIGDSKIFRYSRGQLEQLSTDHVAPAAYGIKPPLSQNLGIPPEEMLIEPYIRNRDYQGLDLFLLCSDGLTDMLDTGKITEILGRIELNQNERSFESGALDKAARRLVEEALINGGKDNITVLLCGIEKNRPDGGRSFLKLRKGRGSDKRWQKIS